MVIFLNLSVFSNLATLKFDIPKILNFNVGHLAYEIKVLGNENIENLGIRNFNKFQNF